MSVKPRLFNFSDTNLEKADQAALKALELGAGDPEIHLQIGYYYLLAYDDRGNQEKHWEIASKGLPNNVEFLKGRYTSLRKQGKWEEALEEIKRAAKLDPNDTQIYTQLGLALWFIREYADSDAAWNKSITASPDDPFPPHGKVFNLLTWKGICDETATSMQNLNPRNGWNTWLKFWFAAGSGQFEEALQLVSDTSQLWVVSTAVYSRPSSLFRAFIFRFQGKNDLARKNFLAASTLLEKKIREVPDDVRYHSTLGIAYAGLGRRESALAEMERAIELLPLSVDAMYGTSPAFDAVIVYLFLGELDLAMEQLEFLISLPSPYSIKYLEWYLPLVPLKEHSRYTELLSQF